MEHSKKTSTRKEDTAIHIIKGQTRAFQDYEVKIIERVTVPKKKFWQKTFAELFSEEKTEFVVETPVKGVVEADEHTGLLVTHEHDEFGNGLYTNGLDTISTDNAVKVLLLAPVFRAAFHQAGFRPKLITRYVDELKIKYNGPPLSQTIVKTERNSKEMVETQ